MAKPRLIFFSGLGADHRAFSFLRIPAGEIHWMDWIEPLEGESFSDYGLRMTQHLDLGKDDILIGLSMGGIMAQIIASQIPVKKVILISSLRFDQKEPRVFPLGRKLGFPSPLSPKALKKAILGLLNIYPPLREEQLRIFKDMVDSFSPEFYHWAIRNIIRWDHVDPGVSIAQIHGTKDEVFPVKNVFNAELIKGATHLMVATHPKEVSDFLDQEIKP